MATKDRAMVFKLGQMGHVMRATGNLIKPMARANLFILLGTFIMVNGKMIKLMDMEFSPILIVRQNTKGSGWTIFSMARESKLMGMGTCMKVYSRMEKDMAKENTFL